MRSATGPTVPKNTSSGLICILNIHRNSSMAAIPRFRIEAFDGSNDTSLGMLDLTESIAGSLTRQPRLAEDWIKGQGVLISHLSPFYNASIDKVAYAGNLSLPRFGSAFERFLKKAGGVESMKALYRTLKDIRHADWDVVRAEEELDQVRKASWQEDVRAFEFLFSRHLQDEYVQEAEGAFDDWIWNMYVESDPAPRDVHSPEYEAWKERSQAWLRNTAPPFLFGTVPNKWFGLAPLDVRAQFEEEEKVHVWDLIENSLSNHHEEAEDQVVDAEGIEKIVTEWLPHAGKGTSEDLALERLMAEWNDKQDIVSYYPDTSVIVPAWDGATHEAAIAWAERRVDAARAKVAELEDSWQPPQAEPATPADNATP